MGCMLRLVLVESVRQEGDLGRCVVGERKGVGRRFWGMDFTICTLWNVLFAYLYQNHPWMAGIATSLGASPSPNIA